MCGIFGAFSPFGLDEFRCNRSLRLLRHRGPDNLTLHVYRHGQLALGHSRLKILDLSDKANQPFVSNCGNYEIVFNGEIYNFRELRKKFCSDISFRTSSDTEVLINLYRAEGARMLGKLNGMFAFAIWDRLRNRIFLARDRFGIKPLYFADTGKKFVFSSEIKPILHMLGDAAPNERMIATYLASSHSDFCEATFFTGIEQLPAGAHMLYDCNTRSREIYQWYSFAERVRQTAVPCIQETTECVAEAIERSIHRHLVSDVDVGLNVSGGVDSATLVHFVTQLLGASHSFTQEFSGYSERVWIEEIAKGKPLIMHYADLDSGDILAELEQTVIYQEQPFGGVAVVGYSFLYQMARNNDIFVLLDGNGSDEIFLGYKKYHIEHLKDMFGKRQFSQILEDYCRFWGEEKGVALARLAALSRDSGLIDGTPHVSAVGWGEALSVQDLYQIPDIGYFEDGVRNSAARDLLHTKIPRGLRFNDRMSMMHSCELRVPFLDHELVETAYAIPIDRLIDTDGTKAVLRRALAGWVDPEIAFSPKRSIQTPQNDWLAEDWRDFVGDLISSRSFRERGWLVPEKAWQAFDSYLSGDRATSFFIWQWINLELWAKAFFDERCYLDVTVV